MHVVRERGISRAAHALNISQPAVSQAVKRLETQLGGTLLYRKKSGMQLTVLGDEIYKIACELYSTVARIDGVLAAQSGEVHGPLRLLVMSGVHSKAYDEFLMTLHRRYGKIELHVEMMSSAAIIKELTNRTPALGIYLCTKTQPLLEQRLFVPHQYVFVCGRHHPLFSGPEPSMEALQHEDFVGFKSDQLDDTLSPLTIFRHESGFTGRVIGASNAIEEVRRMVIAGLGIGCLPEHLIRHDLESGNLRRLLPGKVIAQVDAYLGWHRYRKLSQAEQTFIEEFDAFLERTPVANRGG